MLIGESAQLRLRNVVRRCGYEVVRVSSGPGAESLLALHLSKLFARESVDVVLDVGARVGDYAVFLRRNGFAGRIISFEPVPASIAALRARAAADPLWTVVPAALGKATGTAEINVTNYSAFSSFLTANDYGQTEFGAKAAVAAVEPVPVLRLDEVLADLLGAPPAGPPARVYLKMDTQGWDLQVLAGAAGVLDQVVALQSEIAVRPIYTGMPAFETSLSTLAGLGYHLSGLFPVTHDSRLRVVEFDCVCVQADAPG